MCKINCKICGLEATVIVNGDSYCEEHRTDKTNPPQIQIERSEEEIIEEEPVIPEPPQNE